MEVDQTVSVSKGVFVFKNNFKPLTKLVKSKRKQKNVVNYQNTAFSSNAWYQSYSSLWQNIEEKIENLNNAMFSSVLSRLVNFVKSSHDFDVEEIPTAALLTGINMPDHAAQFKSLSNQIKESVTPHVACLHSQDCQNIKYLIENMIGQLVKEDESFSDEDSLSDSTRTHLKKSQLNLSVLQCWYENMYQEHSQTSPKKQKTKNKKILVIIISDFESFNAEVLQKFILIASCYIRVLPFVFIFGIATSISTLHTSLPYKVSSKICVKVFNSQRSTCYLNEILENVFFSTSCPFQMGGKVFNLFIDIFLFYDLSVNNFIQNIKYAMAEHFSYGNAMALCSFNKKETSAIIAEFSHEDLENVRHLLSFRKLVESETYENQIRLLTDDDYFANVLTEEIVKLQKYIRRLHIFLKCLLILVEDLPKAPLGQQLRDLYSVATAKNITNSPEYKECFKLLGFQSMEELSKKLSKILDYLEDKILFKHENKMKDFYEQLESFVDSMNNFNMAEMEEAVVEIENNEQVALKSLDRKQFKEKLFGMTKSQNQPLNRYEKLREKIITTLSQAFEEYLIEPKSFYFHEIFFFNNISIQSNIIGSHRSAIHNALNDPQYYLQCDCCTIPNSSVIKHTMPDICIAYKLHLECGKIINLYDWLQAFLSIVDPIEIDDETKRIVSPELQARFTQCVAELEYLGFIKSTKRKADHVARLTWGG
ncbi:unnamed protein product [Phaedon cochleariae]|uniref:Origin recognition complex subunit 3 n=1 Tax=Phaedon cochleariae TaxID=80249 RepID=A0A9P0DEN0_PHACE|nr:unnamed protein product [Phaedon cochleariae]